MVIISPILRESFLAPLALANPNSNKPLNEDPGYRAQVPSGRFFIERVNLAFILSFLFIDISTVDSSGKFKSRTNIFATPKLSI